VVAQARDFAPSKRIRQLDSPASPVLPPTSVDRGGRARRPPDVGGANGRGHVDTLGPRSLPGVPRRPPKAAPRAPIRSRPRRSPPAPQGSRRRCSRLRSRPRVSCALPCTHTRPARVIRFAEPLCVLDTDVSMPGVHQEVRALPHADHTIGERWEILLKGM
jgi:hypothetical protein